MTVRELYAQLSNLPGDTIVELEIHDGDSHQTFNLQYVCLETLPSGIVTLECLDGIVIGE